jgi:putative peptide zinc metalloprotease protein
LSYILCPSCKFKTLSGYVFCKHCGNDLNGAVVSLTTLTLSIQKQSEPSDKDTTNSIKEQSVSSFVLAQGTTKIGRMDNNNIVLIDEQVSRHHAAIDRDSAGRYLVKDLQSTNGTYLNGVRLRVPSIVEAGDELRIGNTLIRFDKAPQSSEELSGDLHLSPEATLVSLNKQRSVGAFETMFISLWTGQTQTENFRPQARDGWALKHLVNNDEGDYFVLKSLHDPVYIRLAERDVFLWKLMDGQHTLRDILIAYLQTYQALGADRLIDLLDELVEKGFLQNAIPKHKPAPNGSLARGLAIVRKVLGAFIQTQFPVHGVDGMITRLYTHFAWLLYTLTGQIALGAIAIAGLAAFIIILMRGDQSLFEVQGSIALGLVALALANTVSVFLHEMGHALTVKSFNRQVRRVGFMIYFGMPAFYVDTSDIWMEPKGPRIQTSLAGPYVSFLVGSVTSLVMLSIPSPLINALLFQLAAWSYINTFFNLNPLLELDGYFILMDWLEMPLLRKRSLEFVQQQLGRKLRQREAFSRDEKLFALFGILSAIWSVIAIGIFFFFEGPALLAIFQGELSGAVSLVTVILLVAVLGLIAWLAKRDNK